MNEPERLSEVLSEAVRYFAEHGYDSEDALNYWLHRIRLAILERGSKPPTDMAQAALQAVYNKAVRGGLKRYHPELPPYAIQTIAPNLRPILQSRILASADLIKLNREQAVETTLRRFSGWATSQPMGGGPVDKLKTRQHIGKRLQQASYEERRMLIDQGHKLIASINQTVAEGNGAIAMQWHSHWRDPSYDYRPDHKERDERIYLVRGSWAQEKGFLKPGEYLDDITRPAQEPYCRCFGTWLYSLTRLPESMLTEKGKKVMEQTRIKVA